MSKIKWDTRQDETVHYQELIDGQKEVKNNITLGQSLGILALIVLGHILGVVACVGFIIYTFGQVSLSSISGIRSIICYVVFFLGGLFLGYMVNHIMTIILKKIPIVKSILDCSSQEIVQFIETYEQKNNLYNAALYHDNFELPADFIIKYKLKSPCDDMTPGESLLDLDENSITHII